MRTRRPFILAASLLATSGLPLFPQPLLLDPAERHPGGGVPEPIAIGDLNRDGLPDIAIGNTGSGGAGGDNVIVLLGRSGGSLERLGPFPAGNRPEGLVLSRVNGDDFLDVVTSNFEGNTVTVLLGGADGKLSAPISTDVPGGPRSLVAADLDGDGKTDLATSNYGGNTVSILKGNGSGAFTITATIAVGEGPEAIAIGKLNADGMPDLVTADSVSNTITPLLATAPGTYVAGPRHPVGVLPRFILATDLDGDGLDDLVVANNESHTVSLERNAGGQAFATAAKLSPTSPDLQFRRPVYLALADMNGDARLDLLVTWAHNDLFTAHLRTPDPFAFGEFHPVQTGDTPVGIAAADLDGDSGIDVAVCSAVDDSVEIYRTYRNRQGILVDNDREGTSRLGPWAPSTTPFSFGGDSLFSKNGTRYTWKAALPAGRHEALMWWTVTPNRSPAVLVEVLHRDGSSCRTIDQRRGVGSWHSLGAYDFDGMGIVIVTSPIDGESVSADAVRFRPATGPSPTPPAVPITLAAKPKKIALGRGRVLALQADLQVKDAAEPQEWVAAVLSPVGEGEESADIERCRLYIDSNQNGVHDTRDRELGSPSSFESDARVITFGGFAERLHAGSPSTLFVVCELSPTLVGSRAAPREGTPGPPGRTGLGILGAGLLIASVFGTRSRTARILLPGVAVGLLSFSLLGSGCSGSDGSGGGGGGGSDLDGGGRAANLRLELSSLAVRAEGTKAPAAIQGLPLEGWNF